MYTHTLLTEANLQMPGVIFVMLIALRDANTRSLPFYTITAPIPYNITMQSTSTQITRQAEFFHSPPSTDFA